VPAADQRAIDHERDSRHNPTEVTPRGRRKPRETSGGAQKTQLTRK
jgi:hypothetical protein